jgi:small-conductance mechanosensitive channel
MNQPADSLAAIFWERIYRDNSAQELVVAVTAAAVIFFLIMIVRTAVTRHLRHVAEHTKNRIDDLAVEVVASTRVWAALIASACIGMLMLRLPAEVEQVIRSMVTVTLSLQIGLWGSRAVRFLAEEYAQRQRPTGAPGHLGAVSLLSAVLRFGLWVVILLLILDNAGMDITPLIAGLGIGGLAMALAVQNTLADLFASISIVLDRPFDLGDTIVVGDMTGTVERIGIRTSRLRASTGEELIFGNNDLLKARIRNLTRTSNRRAVVNLRLDYATAPDQAEAVPALLEEIICAQADTRFERAALTGLDDSGITVEASYRVTHPDFARFVAIRQEVSLAILRALADRGVHMAYPTQTVNVRSQAA